MRFYGFRLAAVALSLSFWMSLNGESMDAEKLSERTLSSAGFSVGINASANVITAIGVFCSDVETNADDFAVERLRQKGIRSALLDAKGKLALTICGRSEMTKELLVSGDSEAFQVVCKVLADINIAGCMELPCSESWSKEYNVYKVAVPLVYKKDKNPNVVFVSRCLDEKDLALLSTKVGSLDARQRIGCFKWIMANDVEYIVAFGSSVVDGMVGRDLHKAIKKAELMALGNMAFWLGSDMGVRIVAEEYIQSREDKPDNWESYSEKVFAQCKHKHFPCNEVSYGRCVSPITKKQMYWCAFGARLTHAKNPVKARLTK